jgi:hypothetical protein
MEQAVVTKDHCATEKIVWTDESLPERQEVWRTFAGVNGDHQKDEEAVLETFRGLIAAYEGKDLDGLMPLYSPDYRDSNGYSAEYVRRAWLWWDQRTVIPYVVTQVRRWDTSRAAEGIVSFTAWNRFRAMIVWDQPFGCHGRVRIPCHDGDRVTWTWKQDNAGQWKILRTEPALPNFGEMLWNSRGHDVNPEMKEFTDTPDSRRSRESVQRK